MRKLRKGYHEEAATKLFRRTDLARKFNKAGLLSDKGLKAVESAARKPQ